MSQLQLKNITFKLQYFAYILCKFDEVWSSNFGDYEVTKFELWGRCGKNWHISPYISESTGSVFTKFSVLVDVCG